ncbi:MAG: HEAT repeat domain-containing protein [Polyangiaceae bacterium]|nr:HEAT repeat domain-containing protein [Polyangiaceae bacterium]
MSDILDAGEGTLVRSLLDTGVLVGAGLGWEGEVHCSFLHRSFLEYLAARELATRDDHVEIALRNVYAPEWQEVLKLLGGVAGARPREYIAALLEENREDLLARPFRIAIGVAMEAATTDLVSRIRESLTNVAVEVSLSAPPWGSEHLLHWDTGAMRMIVDCGSLAVPRLLTHLRSGRAQIAGHLLGACSPAEAMPILEGWLSERNELLRRRAASILGAIGSGQAVRLLLGCLKDDDHHVFGWAAQALARSGSPEGGPALLEALLAARNYDFSHRAGTALSYLVTSDMVPDLLRVLESDADYMREGAVMALEGFPSGEVTQSLVRALREDEDYIVRWVAADALGKGRCGEAFVPLLDALRDPEPAVCYAAARAAGGFRTERATASVVERLANADDDLRHFLVLVLVEMGTRASAAAVVQELRIEEAVSELERCQLPSGACNQVTSALESYLIDVHGGLIESAGTLAAELASKHAVPCLERLMEQQPDMQWQIVKAFRAIDRARAEAAILRYLCDPRADEKLKVAIVEVLGQVGSMVAVPAVLRCLSGDWLGSRAWDALEHIGWRERFPVTTTAAPDHVRHWVASLDEDLESVREILRHG